MSTVIRIPEPIFIRLQALAKPFVDTPASVIGRLLDFYEAHTGTQASSSTHAHTPTGVPNNLLQLDPDNPIDLHHTRVIEARFGDTAVSNWNKLVYVAHRFAGAKTGSVEELCGVSISNIARGRRTDSGFHYFPDIDISIQNVDANAAWRNTLHLARKLDIPVRVVFEWRNKDRAANPGKKGVLEWKPKQKRAGLNI
ncbi:MAG: hypothetical protein DRJ18_01335 [Candidatus Methanomethylicota archaeon]|nr:MAG: hypothetical protein DRJ18_01335 [Candidatus Verstraetearchaeota archaeon]